MTLWARVVWKKPVPSGSSVWAERGRSRPREGGNGVLLSLFPYHPV